jgi:ATP-binding cassette, subfamily B, bacterial PglK
MVFGGFLEMANIGALVPFLGILASPESIRNYDWLNDFLFHVLKIDVQSSLIVLLTAVFCGVILLSAAFRVILLWLNTRLSHAIGNDFEVEVFRKSLYRPYHEHVAQNSSNILAGIEKARSTSGALLSYLNITYVIVVSIFLMIAFLIVDPTVSLTTAGVLFLVYLIASLLSRRRLKENGTIMANLWNFRMKSIQESFGGIRDILLEGNQQQYCGYFGSINYRLKWATGSNTLIAQTPRLVVEPVGIIVIALFASLLSVQEGFQEAIPTLGTLAFGAQRLLPLAQLAFIGWSGIKGTIPMLTDVFELIGQPIRREFLEDQNERIDLKEKLVFEDVSFLYPTSSKEILKDISFSINSGSCIGIIGTTGSGKTTLLDLLLGLLYPSTGIISIDGRVIDQDLRKMWQKSIAHVPQDIYLADTSIVENIAFGLQRNEIDMQKVHQAAAQAQASEFINDLERGYDTKVGERGIQLSGGQKQRIGIARALYRGASTIIFDEATSALDETTENAVIEAINDLSNKITLFIVSHRITALRYCDEIIVLGSGKVVATGPYESIIKNSNYTQYYQSKNILQKRPT